MKTCALVAASNFNADAFLSALNAGRYDCVIAVDGGFAHLASIKCEPDYVIGDFDSLGFVPEGDNVAVYPTQKDKSDLELALDFSLARGFLKFVVYGALGGRLDHSLANLQLCAGFAERGVEMTFVDTDCAIRVLVGPSCFHIPQAAQGIVSVFSATAESFGVTEKGLKYTLEDARLTNRTSLGLSNELIGQPASISLEKGTLYIFYPLS